MMLEGSLEVHGKAWEIFCIVDDHMAQRCQLSNNQDPIQQGIQTSSLQLDGMNERKGRDSLCPLSREDYLS